MILKKGLFQEFINNVVYAKKVWYYNSVKLTGLTLYLNSSGPTKIRSWTGFTHFFKWVFIFINC